MKPSFLFDSICLILVVVIAAVYARKGFAAGIVRLVGNLVSLVGAWLASHWASAALFDQFLAPGFTEKITRTIEESGTVDLTAIVSDYAGFLPQELIQQVLAPVEQALADAAGAGAPAAAQAVVEQAIRPLFLPVLSIVVYFVVFALLRMVVSLLVALLSGLNKVPVLGTVNYWMGFAAGALAGLLDLFLILCAVWALLVVTGDGLPWLNSTVLADSIAYQAFGAINPFW